MLTFAHATANDIKSICGNTRETVRAICAKRDGIPVGIIGIAYDGFQAKFFSEHTDMTCVEIIRSWRAVKMAMQFVRESKRPVVAVAQDENGHKNLTRLGFQYVGQDYYLWPS